jgi:methyl-accepting chemotaxis protein
MLDIYWSLIVPLAIVLAVNILLFTLIKGKVIQKLNLTKNLIVVLLTVTVVPLLCTGYASHRKISTAILTDIREKLQSIGRTRTIFLNEKLEEVKLDAEMIAKNWIVIEILRKVSVEGTDRSSPDFKTISANTQKHLNRIASTKGYNDIMLVSAEAKITVTGTEHSAETGLDVSGETFFKQGKEKTCFTDLFYNKSVNKNLMYVTTPCLDLQGQFLGCVVIEMNLIRIYDVLVDRNGLGESGETYIVNRDKLMVSESRFMKDAVLKVRVDTVGVNDGLMGKSGVATYLDYRNIPVIGAWNPIKYTDWVLLTEINKAEAFAPLRANMLNHIILLSVTIVMVTVIAIFSAQATVKPIRELIEVSEQVREGKLNKEVKIHSYDEIGILINVFNEMIKNMRSLAEQATIISKGNLAISVEGKGDLALAFNNMLEGLRTLIRQTQESIARLSSASMEMLSSSEEQASSSAELAASIGEITATIEELSSSAKQVAANVESVAKAAEDSDATGRQGMESILASIRIMEDIRETTKDNAKKIVSLSERSQKIGDVLGIIKDIAGETHLLALNASIEASSAGESGKRFGVVAVEVRRLAERTKTYAEEIKDIISEIQMSTSAAVLSTEQSVKNVEKGVDVIQRAGHAIESNLSLIEKTTDASRQIAMATQQQKSATEQVSGTMREISEVVKQTAAGMKQSTAVIAELNKLTDDLKGMIHRFKT